jgi:Ca-activated chloride channel family protein
MPKNEEQLAILTDEYGEGVALKGVKAHARLHGLLAEVEVEQSYRNPQDTNIEAVYTFPLPFGAVLLGLEVEIAGKKLAGQVVEKKEAERRYEDAVTDGDSAVMLEEAGPGLYTASLGNLMAGESAVIRYRYGLLLNWQGDRLRFLLPTTIAPRYGDAEAAGLQPHQTPESSLTVEYPLELVVDVDGELASAALACPSHPIAMERTDTGLRVRLDKKAFLDRDFVLTLASDKVQSSCVVVPDGEGHVALASLRIPPVPELERQPLALKLVIDCSGSMGGTSIAQARKAGLAILNQLRPGDSFNVTLFGSEFKHFFRKMVPATAQYITEAWNQIDRMDANLGGTEMEKALDAVFALKGESTLGTVLLITDGEIEEHEKLVRRAEQSGQRVFVVGVGTSVAETFLRNLANATNGACELVAPQEGMSEFVLSQFHRMRQQRVGKLSIQWPAVNQWQTRLPETVFAGDTVHVFAGFEQVPVGEVRLIIEGRDAVVTAITPLDDPQVPRIAAARRLEDVPESEARGLALRHQLLSRWTNFLVIAERADKAEDLPELHKVPQMLAAGWGGTGTGVVADLFVPGKPRNSRAQIMSNDFVDKHNIPVFLRKQCSDDEQSKRIVFSKNSSGSTGGVFEKLSSLVYGVFGASQPEMSNPLSDDQGTDTRPLVFVGNMKINLLPNLPQLSLPAKIEELVPWGLDDAVLHGLRTLTGKGYAEARVIVAFIHALSESCLSSYFGRDLKRGILRVWKQVNPRIELDSIMREALKDVSTNAWNWPQEPADLIGDATV